MGSAKGNLLAYLTDPNNLPIQRDKALLLKIIAEYTTVGSFEAADATQQQLTLFDPSKYNFNIVQINLSLKHLFIRYAQSPFGANSQPGYKVYFTLSAYQKIKQPTKWVQFVENRKSQHSLGTLTDHHALMVDAVALWNELDQFQDEYKPSLKSANKEFIAMKATFEKETKRAASRSTKPKAPATKKTSKQGEDGEDARADPPFITHTKNHPKDGGEPYKEDETKTWNGTKFISMLHLRTGTTSAGSATLAHVAPPATNGRPATKKRRRTMRRDRTHQQQQSPT